MNRTVGKRRISCNQSSGCVLFRVDVSYLAHEFGNAVGDVYIRKVARKDGRLVNSVIKTYPNVSQFWTYGQAEFLKNPVYSRDYPPAKNLEQ